MTGSDSDAAIWVLVLRERPEAGKMDSSLALAGRL
jgi:hypothetical protein